MNKLHGKLMHFTFTQLLAYVTLFLLLGAIFITINNTLQQQSTQSTASNTPKPYPAVSGTNDYAPPNSLTPLPNPTNLPIPTIPLPTIKLHQ